MDGQHKSIAVIADWIGPYQRPILMGLQHTLNQAGMSVTHYLGELHPTTGLTPQLRFYDLIDLQQHSGVFMLTSTLSNFSTPEQMMEFTRQFSGLPQVGFGRKIEGVPTVQLSNEDGMGELMQHLLSERKFRRFVFIRGIAGNLEAQVRERVFVTRLQEHGLDPSGCPFLNGDFYAPKAKNTLSTFLTDHMEPIDCVVCANDDMALAAITALEEHGWRVPDDVAVVGFDDAEESLFASPPLTTVKQPLFEMGEVAGKMLVHLLQGHPQEDVLVPSRLVVRESCGTPVLQTLNQPPTLLAANPPEAGKVHEVLLENLFPECHDHFLLFWHHTLKAQARNPQDLEAWQGVLERWVQQSEGLPYGQRMNIQRLCEKASQMLWKWMRQLDKQRNVKKIQHTRHLARISTSLGAHETLDSLLEDLKWNLTALGLEKYALVLYDQFGITSGLCGSVRLSQGVGTVPPEEFSTVGLLPGFALQGSPRDNWQVHPMNIKDEHYGYFMMVEPDHWGGDPEVLRYIIARSIHHVVKTQSLKQYSENLEFQVQDRTQQLEQANQELRRTMLLDGLTGVYNRSAFDDYLKRMWLDHQRSAGSLAVIMCDVDHFKKYNDTYGHLQGDECLRQVAKAIGQAVMRPADMLARYGGEEFVVVLPETDAEGARRVAQRIQESVTALRIPHRSSESAPHVTLSIGVNAMVAVSGVEATLLVKQADQALYRSKHLQRNCITVF